MKIKNILLLLSTLAFIPTILWAQRQHMDVDQQFEQFSLNRNLFFNFNLYNFRADSPDSSQICFVATLVNDLLQFVKQSDSLYIAQFELSIMIKTEKDSSFEMHTFHKQIRVKQFQDTNARSVVHTYFYIFNLPPAKYTMNLELTDLDTKKSLKRQQKFEARNFGDEPINFCEPVFRTIPTELTYFPPEPLQGSYDERTAKDSKLIANLLAPFKIGNLLYYRISTPVTFYQEIYQNDSQDSLQLSYRLIDNQNRGQWQQHETLFSPGQNRFIKEFPLDPNAYPPGLYVLQVLIKKDTLQKITQLRLFLNHTANFMSGDSTLADEILPLKYIMPEDKYAKLNSLSISLRDSAIAQFWRERNPTPEAGDNPLHTEFLRRASFANQNFFSLIENRQGCETDQGKIYILYGPPAEITHPISPNAEYEHEVWIYHTPDLNRRFIFVFKPEKGEYQLMRGE